MKIRDGQIDVAIVAGPRLKTWPTQGARVLSRYCADAGLKVGWYGGPDLQVRGVLPMESGGSVVMVEDLRQRLHRIQAKAVVKITPDLEFPMPFQGWYSPGLIPETTARKLITQGSLNWQSVVVILGTGNRAFRLGSELLERHLSSRVVCLESVFKEVQGFEVERRRFEMRGGKVIFGTPTRLQTKTPFTWELKVQDQQGVRVLDCARVISVGPFTEDSGYREYPPGSLMFEWENSEAIVLADDVEKVSLDEARGVVLASRIIKGLANVSSEFKTQLERTLWINKQKIREFESLKEHRLKLEFDGKWLGPVTKKIFENHGGTLKQPTEGKILATIECVENIGCRVCEKSCPSNAIRIDREKNQFLFEDACTGCGFCLQACPSQVPVMIEGDGTQSFTQMIFPFTEKPVIKKGDRVNLLSRKGEVLNQGRVLDQFLDGNIPLFKVEVPSHLIWEVRGLLPLGTKAETENANDFYEEKGTRVEVQFQGDTRRVREGQLLSVALFESGIARPNDILVCEDGACGLCQVEVDGIKKFACKTTIHQGMNIRFTRDHPSSSELCPCEGVDTAQLNATVQASKPDTMEALAQVCDVAQGRCHGLLCKKSWVKLAEDAGVQVSRYNDWRFPWMDWTLR